MATDQRIDATQATPKQWGKLLDVVSRLGAVDVARGVKSRTTSQLAEKLCTASFDDQRRDLKQAYESGRRNSRIDYRFGKHLIHGEQSDGKKH